MSSSTRRTILWAVALVGALAVVALAFVEAIADGDGGTTGQTESSVEAPAIPGDVGNGCGAASLTDPADLSGSRPVARCAPGSPAARPLTPAVRLRVALTDRGETAAPLLLADRLGEFAAEGLDVEIVDLASTEAFAALAAGDVDAVVGPVDAPYFDAVDRGAAARLVLGGALARAPGDTAVAQPGLWFRSDLLSRHGRWYELAGMPVGLAAGWRSAAVYPVATVIDQGNLSLNDVEVVTIGGDEAVEELMGGKLAAAWLDQPAWARIAEAEGFELGATLPATESIDGTVVSARLLEADREAGVAYARAVIRTINTHLANDYRSDDAVMPALARATGASVDELAATPALLFDWEIRAGTTDRLQEAMVEVGSVGYERPLPEDELVDRSLALDGLGLRAR
jgi:NitT/TauT family transport system substrate-binding protein